MKSERYFHEQCILIVDDQETIVVFLRDTLEKLGFEVETASNGLEGLEVMGTESVEGFSLISKYRSWMA